MICAGIVSYNPCKERLMDNIKSIISQVAYVIIVDNGSANYTQFSAQLSVLGDKIIIIRNTDNKGIACALNQIMEQGEILGATWVLTLDQDSICPTNLIQEYEKHSQFLSSLNVKNENVGIICPIIHDRSAGLIEIQNTKEII